MRACLLVLGLVLASKVDRQRVAGWTRSLIDQGGSVNERLDWVDLSFSFLLFSLSLALSLLTSENEKLIREDYVRLLWFESRNLRPGLK